MSMIKNDEVLLTKADAALSTIQVASGGAGELVPEQAAKFVRLVVKEGVLTRMGSVKTMRNPTYQLPKARFGSRVLHAAKESQGLSLANRSAPDTSLVELEVKKFAAEVRMSYELLEDSIEREAFAETIMQLMADAISRDIDEITLLSDLTSADPDLSQFDGIIAQATSNLVAAGGVALNKDVLLDMQKSMPSEYLRRRAGMVYLTSVDAELDYRDSLGNRATDLGDIVTSALGAAPDLVRFHGLPVVPVHMMPENLGGGSNETVALLLEPKQIHFGFRRNITFEIDRDIHTQEHKLVMSCRWDVKYEHEPAVVKAEGITVS